MLLAGSGPRADAHRANPTQLSLSGSDNPHSPISINRRSSMARSIDSSGADASREAARRTAEEAARRTAEAAAQQANAARNQSKTTPAQSRQPVATRDGFTASGGNATPMRLDGAPTGAQASNKTSPPPK